MENDEQKQEDVEQLVENNENSVQKNEIEELDSEQEASVEEKTKSASKEEKKKKNGWLIPVVLILLICVLGYCLFTSNKPKDKEKESVSVGKDAKEVKSEYRMSGNSLENFDLSFLKLENGTKNKVYSPLSIKYALAMLAEGAKGETKEQITNIIGDYKAKSYPNNEHMSFANAMFIRENLKDSIMEEYTNAIKSQYNAEVLYDDFSTPNAINNWVSEKTFKLINNLVDDVSNNTFFLINALAIDMEWNNQVHCVSDHKIPCVNNGMYQIKYDHETLSDDQDYSYSVTEYPYSDINDFYGDSYRKHIFNDKENIKGGDILADFNRYDIISDLGEDKIRETVRVEYEKWLQTEEGKNDVKYGYSPSNPDEYLDKFIDEIKSNYGKAANSTDFLLYEDDQVKSFAKDLKEYDGMTLQYVGIMPKEKDLTDYINNLKVDDVSKVIKNLKEVKIESFKEGYATRIRGFIPFFQFEYELQLLDDLKKLGIENAFDGSKADFSELTKAKGTSINKAIHKATIEFSNDGIKASAATAMGGYGAAGGGFDYVFKIPTEEIDLSFNKPYMYLIRDKESGEVWFVGTVYEPISK